ncbi:hypothetical protein CCHR01_12108 [Colletotrichum chrysophilum]|uniref:Uncharacterized protein n=1 Tax=Colletotrichum chrysophilum TaxID=1836956 RepID=A0AAD9EEG3_9PEZI|nr:hypothetical protein CCHR01_12108 [Colletotrichum chrysophilum]
MYNPLVSETEQRIWPVTDYTTVHERANLVEVLDGKEIMPDRSTSLALIPSRTCSLSISSLGDPYRLPNMKREDSILFHYYDRFRTVALRHQSAVLQGLQQSLNKKKRTSFSRLELLSTILMLCFYEIYNAGQSPKDLHGLPTRPWMTHAGGVRRLLDLCQLESHDSHYEKAVVSFLSQYFASRSVLAFTSLSPLEDGVEIVDHAWYWLGMADRPPQEINPFAGCSNEMLTSILVITSRMRHIGRSRSQPLPSLQQTSANMMAKSLFAMDQHPPAETSGQILCVLEEIWPLLVGHKVAARTNGYSFLWESAMLDRHQVLEWV